VTAWLRAHWARLVSGLALAAVAAVAGVVSYQHIESLTLALHQTLTVGRLMPFGVDGLIVVGSVMLLTAEDGTEWLGWLGVGPGVAASLFANVESGIRYGWLAATWAGVPAGSFFLACFLFERWLKAQVGRGGKSGQAEEDSTVPVLAEVDANPCSHIAAFTVEEAAVQAFMHARDCLGIYLSQRKLSDQFGLSRPRVAELVKQLDGYRLDDRRVDEDQGAEDAQVA